MNLNDFRNTIKAVLDHKSTELHIVGRGLREIPAEIGNLEVLPDLHIMSFPSNSIASVHQNISKLKHLRRLDFNNNNISEFPLGICQINGLTSLNLSNNNISEIPSELNNLRQLSYLDLRNNPLPIPIEILSHPDRPSEILNYYFTHKTGTKKPLHEAKVIVVGQGSVGKTSLIKRMTTGEFSLTENKTEGISIKHFPLKLDNQTIKLNIWDFGGQEIMHATHQFFLTKRSLYVLVIDSRLSPEENRLDYWLKIIQAFGSDSPIIVVGNKIDQHPLDLNKKCLSDRYPNIRCFIETSCANGKGIRDLLLAISKEIISLPHINDELLLSWFAVKNELENMKVDYTTYENYISICVKNGITNKTSQRTLIGFLHDLGVILNFRDDSRLADTNVLNPDWVTNGVYRILNSNELFNSKGILTHAQLGEILDHKRYPQQKHNFIMDMMKKFELCYEFEDTNPPKYLVPDLITQEEPYTGEWGGASSFQYSYNILPSSIISRFIVRMYPFIYQNTVWRSGVIIKSGESTALIKADYENRNVLIRTMGKPETRRELLSMIRDTIERINSSIQSIEVTRQVPHPEYPDLVFDLDELATFNRQGVKEFPKKAGKNIISVNVRKLISETEGGRRAQVFISYSHKDDKFTQRVAKDLISAGISIWQDRLSLMGGTIWADEIERGLLLSSICLVILSPNSISSDWVKKEYTYAMVSKRRVVPLLYKECSMPFLLTNVQYVDFCSRTYQDGLVELQKIIQQGAY